LRSAGHNCALAAWAKHARVLLKVPGGVSIYDPWKQDVRVPAFLSEAGKPLGQSVTFTKHDAEQEVGEGSCQFASLSRLLMVALYGDRGISMRFSASEPEALAVPVAAQMLIRTSRGRLGGRPGGRPGRPLPPAPRPHHDETRSIDEMRRQANLARLAALAAIVPEDTYLPKPGVPHPGEFGVYEAD
jgi:hypothetical protein